LLLQVDTSVTCTIPYSKCTGSTLHNKSLTCFNTDELKLLSVCILAWWNCDCNSNGTMFIFTFLSTSVGLAQDISFCTEVMWDKALMNSCWYCKIESPPPLSHHAQVPFVNKKTISA
jgi:hypothetical protein